MKATFTEKQDNKVRFEIEYTAEEFENALIEAYKKTKDQFRVDGFRQGKAPRKIIMQRYGEKVFDEDAIEGLLQKDYPASLIELEIEPIDHPRVDLPELKHGEGFIVKIEVDTPPEFEVKDYEGVRIDEVDYPFTEEAVDRQLEAARERGMRLVATDREAQEGDTVTIDFTGSVDGVEFPGGADTDHNLKLGSGAFIAGFEEQLVGRKAGDELDVKVTFPEEYHAEELAGKEAVFTVKISEVRFEERPELNDEYAKDISEFDTLEELRADIKEKIIEQNEMRAEMQMKDAILEKIFDSNDIEVPEVMVDDQLEEMLKEFEQEIQQAGFKLEQYFQMTGQPPSELREKIKGDAYKRVKMKLIVQNIARQQGFEAAEEEIGAELDKMAEQYGIERDKIADLLGDFHLKLLKDDIKNKKAVDYVYENAIIESKEEDDGQDDIPEQEGEE